MAHRREHEAVARGRRAGTAWAIASAIVLALAVVAVLSLR
jgi:hypothetical protein